MFFRVSFDVSLPDEPIPGPTKPMAQFPRRNNMYRKSWSLLIYVYFRIRWFSSDPSPRENKISKDKISAPSGGDLASWLGALKKRYLQRWREWCRQFKLFPATRSDAWVNIGNLNNGQDVVPETCNTVRWLQHRFGLLKQKFDRKVCNSGASTASKLSQKFRSPWSFRSLAKHSIQSCPVCVALHQSFLKTVTDLVFWENKLRSRCFGCVRNARWKKLATAFPYFSKIRNLGDRRRTPARRFWKTTFQCRCSCETSAVWTFLRHPEAANNCFTENIGTLESIYRIGNLEVKLGNSLDELERVS